jgi:hypothetical protein
MWGAASSASRVNGPGSEIDLQRPLNSTEGVENNFLVESNASEQTFVIRDWSRAILAL